MVTFCNYFSDSKKKEKKKKKRNTHIVSFDEEDSEPSLHHVGSSEKKSGAISQTSQEDLPSFSVTSPSVESSGQSYVLNREPSRVSVSSFDQTSISSADFDIRYIQRFLLLAASAMLGFVS